MSLHPALSGRAFQALPFTLKRVATAAFEPDADMDDIRRAMTYATDDNLPPEQMRAFLPIVYRHLDPAGIPDDLFPWTSASPLAVQRALLVLVAIVSGDPHAPVPALLQPWPRVFVWYLYAIQTTPADNTAASFKRPLIDIDFLVFTFELRDSSDRLLDAVVKTPGYLEHIMALLRLYTSLPQDKKMDELLNLLNDPLGRISSPDCTADNFDRLVSGAGGSVDDLATLLITALRTMLRRSKSQKAAKSESDHKADAPTDTGADAGLLLLLGLVSIGGGAPPLPVRGAPWFDTKQYGPLHECLYARGRQFIPLLMDIAECLTAASDEHDAALGATRVLTTLSALFGRNLADGAPWLNIAMERGLLQFILRARKALAARPIMHEVVKRILTRILPLNLVHLSTLNALQEAIGKVRTESVLDSLLRTDTTAFKESWLRPLWQAMLKAFDDRAGILSSVAMSCVAACDNPRCNKVSERFDFKRCAGCQAAYYCSAACQRADWDRGHGKWCATYATSASCIGKRFRATFPHRARTYFRCVMDNDYIGSWHAIHTSQIRTLMRAADADTDQPVVTSFDFTRYPTGLSVSPLSSPVLAAEMASIPEWADWVVRAPTARGMLQLHRAKMFLDGEVRWVVVPLRCYPNGEFRGADTTRLVQEVAGRLVREGRAEDVDVDGVVKAEVRKVSLFDVRETH
ncbi:hypothetical protein MKEN_00485500 [Mycena kentingensis (nom. inval.)]|nr:hypothetical protein MKEN_00485500 [Mycena kentingensis (nom. inval.)]